MTLEIGLVLGILAVALVLFVTEWLRMDVVALLVLAALALSRLVSPSEALSGFSNPAVVTVWAMFMLSAGLSLTGVGSRIGQQVLRLAGRGELRMIAVIMVTAAMLSAFMANIGVAALMLPVVMDIARRTGRPPSRLLMPLAYGSLLGGLTTLIGTPPNLLAAEALRENGLEPFRLFDFSPVGVSVMLAGIAFVALLGRHLLPVRDPARESAATAPPDLAEQYALQERTAVVRLRRDSLLVGRSLRGSRFSSATGLSVFAIIRDGRARPAPDASTVLRAGDRLLVEGQLDRFNELRGWRELVIEEQAVGPESLVSAEIELAELRLAGRSTLADQTLRQVDFRQRYGVIVLALRRDSTITHTNLAGMLLRPGDRLLVQGRRTHLEQLRDSGEFETFGSAPEAMLVQAYELGDRIFTVRVPDDSILAGRSLAESRISDALSLGVLGLERGDETHLMPEPQERLQPGDRLLVRGRRDSLDVLRGLQQLEIESEAPKELSELESEEAGLTEAILAPRSRLAGKTLSELDFRERYGLQVLAILRGGRAYRSNLRDMALQFGDALLLYGRQEKRALLAREPDFLVLTRQDQAVPRRGKAPLAALIMVGALTPVVLGWLPISIAAVAGATLMVVTGCLTMEEAYRSVEWRSIFLIAGMLPLGVAMQQTGAANLLAEQVLPVVGSLGAWGVLLGLYLITTLATSIIPTAALIVLMAPIVMKASADFGVSPHTVMMAVAVAASANFTSPISHPANVLVMGPGGYRFIDYVKLGVPLTLVVMLVAMLVLPVFWPF